MNVKQDFCSKAYRAKQGSFGGQSKTFVQTLLVRSKSFVQTFWVRSKTFVWVQSKTLVQTFWV